MSGDESGEEKEYGVFQGETLGVWAGFTFWRLEE